MLRNFLAFLDTILKTLIVTKQEEAELQEEEEEGKMSRASASVGNEIFGDLNAAAAAAAAGRESQQAGGRNKRG